MSKIKIGFVGVGYMGQNAHLAQYGRWSDLCEVVAVSDPRYSQAQEVARRYGVPHAFRDHKELLANVEVDAVVAAQPYAHHRALIPDLLNAGKCVLTEKPLALSPEGGQALVDAAAKNKVVYMVGYHKRSDPATEYAKKLAAEWQASGEFGKMRLMRISMPPGDWIGGAPPVVNMQEDYPPVALETTVTGFDAAQTRAYDIFINYYVHQVNALRFFLGDYKLSYADPSGVLLAVHNADGVCGTIEMAAYATTRDWQEVLFIAFEKGFIQVELPPPLADRQAGRVTVMRDNGEPTITQPIMPPLSAMANQARNFILAVKGEQPAPCEAAEALKDLQFAVDYIRAKG